MAVIKIKCFQTKDGAEGPLYYWTPSPTLRKAGWKSLSLGADLGKAIELCEARNAEVKKWRTGGAKPARVKQHVQRATMDWLIAQYRQHLADRVEAASLPREKRKVKPMAKTTQRTYETGLKIIEQWSSGVQVRAVTEESVDVLREALMQPDPETGIIGHHRAHGVLRNLRTLMEYAIKPLKLIEKNPAWKFDLEQPDDRDAVWDEDGGHEDMDALIWGATEIGYPGLGIAAEVAEFIGQREEDLLTLPRTRWQEIKNLPAHQHRQLAGKDGRVMGIKVQPSKTRHTTQRWVFVPIAGDLRERLETYLAATAKLNLMPMTLLADDKTGKAWEIRQFQRMFAKAREKGAERRPGIARLQFRDFRRTCVVRLGELNLSDELIGSVTGHSPGTVKKMLEIYMPRTTTQSATAIATRLEFRRRDSDQADKEQLG